MFVHLSLKVPGSQLNLEFNKGVCGTQTLATGVDWLLERTVGSATNGVSFDPHSFSDLDFADDVALLAELLELLVAVLETTEAASLGLEVNWQKTKVWAAGSTSHRKSQPKGRMLQ